jgi:FMN phosphatase YigB (HAD superfamily)
MGGIVSSSKKAPGMLVTLDAFGTLYRPKEPIAVQYLKIARQFGADENINTADLERSFRTAFKSNYAKHPNYGKADKMTPEKWWESVVVDTFSPHLGGPERVPDGMAHRLYQHFSGRAAYELYADVIPFLKAVRPLRHQMMHGGPGFVLGVITNSDDRVPGILRSLGVRVAALDHLHSNLLNPIQMMRTLRRAKDEHAPGPNDRLHVYDIDNEFDFVQTSYDAGCEKPHSKIFQNADLWATVVFSWRKDQNFNEVAKDALSVNDWAKIHVGNDYHKDYEGARDALGPGFEALHLDRELDPSSKADYQITSLSELATYINLMYKSNFPDAD